MFSTKLTTQPLFPTKRDPSLRVLEQKKMQALQKMSKNHLQYIEQIKKFVANPVDVEHPVPLFQQLNRQASFRGSADARP